MPEILPADTLRALALAGIDAAKQRDVSYADIRVGNTRELRMALDPWGYAPQGWLSLEYAYGVRVKVGGVWGFAFGVSPNVDAVAQAARSAVETARGVARLGARPTELAPAPVVQGAWEPVVAVDPFDISPDDHAKLLGAYRHQARRVLGGDIEPWTEWQRETRVFASSDGSLITQRPLRGIVNMRAVGGHLSRRGTRLPIPGLFSSSAGFELLTGAPIQERVKEATEEAARLVNCPVGEVDVGRYEAVLDGLTFGDMISVLLLQALEMDRVLGYEADGVGTSFLAPTSEFLGQQICDPSVNIAAHRSASSFGAMKWDDEGVATQSFPLVTNGRVQNYFMTRDSAPALAEWAAKQGTPITSYGSAVACAPTVSPTGMASEVHVSPAAQGPTLDELVKQVHNGVVVRNMGRLTADAQLSGGMAYPAMLFEVKKGQITRRLLNGMVQVGTKSFLKSIAQLGGGRTMQQYLFESRRGESFARAFSSTYAPAVLLKQLDVMRLAKAT